MYNLGYACVNMSLSYPQEWGGKPRGTPRITTNRTMIRKTFNQKGLGYASELALQNCLDLEKIIEWNEQNGIKFYRMSSNLFPWASEYRFEQLPDYEEIADSLKRSGDLAQVWPADYHTPRTMQHADISEGQGDPEHDH